MSALRSRLGAGAALATAIVAVSLVTNTFAAGVPANKVAASGSTLEVLGANEAHLLLSETVKINNPTDLILSATAECALTTEVTNGANNTPATAAGQIKFYVKIDGKVVPVSDDDADAGRVVFCERTQTQNWKDTPATTVGGNDDSGDQLTQHLDTREANGFNWMALNVGTNYPSPTADNVHKIELWGEWVTSTKNTATVVASVGNRTLVLEPVKAAHGETVTELG